MFLTYRFLEPIAEFTEVLDQTQTAVAGLAPRARRARPADRAATDRTVRVPLPPGALDVDVRDVTFSYPTRGVTDVARRGGAARRRRAHPGRAAGRPRRRHRFGQDDARAADRPLRRPDRRRDLPRRRAAAVRRQRRAAPAPRRRVAGAVPVRRHDRRQRRLRQARGRRCADIEARSSRASSSSDWVDSAAATG